MRMHRVVTKDDLLNASCRSYHNMIELFFPKINRKITLCSYIEKARELYVSDPDISWVVGRLDYKGIVKAGWGKDGGGLSGSILDKYLSLHQEATNE